MKWCITYGFNGKKLILLKHKFANKYKCVCIYV